MSEKTEQPTPKKLRDARKKGQVAKSKEVSGTLGLIAVISVIWAMSDDYMTSIQEMLILPADVYNDDFKIALKIVVDGILRESILLLLPLIMVTLLAAIFGNIMQFGILFSPESIKPDIKKIDPVQGFKKIFAVKNLVEFAKSIIKILFLSFVVYYVIVISLKDMMNLPYCGTDCIAPLVGVLMQKLLLYSAVAFVVIAVFDYLFERHNFMKQQKMTKDEVKREYKESEGSPEIKSKRKEIHQEILNSAENTSKSDVVIKNPTHIAVGLHYNEGRTPLPVVMVKGRGANARFIIKVAEKEGIPVLENVPLAHALFEVGMADFIPGELIEPVAEVFRWVQEIKDSKDLGDFSDDFTS
ncbi:Yop proteins translocation protein U [invertebrate metagenome]|uniref:Yop proteins translocation protein U n=1 Tax=invertebrate metagenome TaxID=1711999 RepID=A0A2H9T9V3_9ZZZZ